MFESLKNVTCCSQLLGDISGEGDSINLSVMSITRQLANVSFIAEVSLVQ
jgi:hypothetical protein